MFFVETLRGLGVYSLVVAAVVVAGRMPLARLGALSLPLVIVACFYLGVQCIHLRCRSVGESGLGGVSAGFAEGWQPVALAGTFGFVPQGCMFALFYAVRILLILWASFAVSFTTSVEALTGAFASLMRPLRVIRVPVDDVATMLSLQFGLSPLPQRNWRWYAAPKRRAAHGWKRQYLAASVRYPHGIHPLDSALVSPRR